MSCVHRRPRCETSTCLITKSTNLYQKMVKRIQYKLERDNDITRANPHLSIDPPASDHQFPGQQSHYYNPNACASRVKYLCPKPPTASLGYGTAAAHIDWHMRLSTSDTLSKLNKLTPVTFQLLIVGPARGPSTGYYCNLSACVLGLLR